MKVLVTGADGRLLPTEYYDIFHITNSGYCSWHELAKEILKLTGSPTPVIPITSEQYPQKARRPAYSVLNNCQLHLLKLDDMRPWQDALKEKGHIK